MTDTTPTPPTPESGEEQYRRWVEHLKSDVRQGWAGSAAGTQQAISADATASSGDDTIVIDATAWVTDDSAVERSVLPRPVVTVSQSHVQVAPGQPFRVKITVRNVGPVVETYVLGIAGPEGSWLSIVPGEISLFPGSEGVATLMIKPGRTSKLPSGDYVVGIIARSEVDPHESTVAEVIISVTPFFDAGLNLSRTTIDIRQRTTTFAQITNNGNAFVDFNLDLADPDGYLRFKVDDPDFTLAPGEMVWKKISITAPLHLFGQSRTLSMVASLTSLRDHTHDVPLTEVRPTVQRVTLVQRPAIRFRLGILGRILLLLLVVGIIAAFFLSRSAMTGSDQVQTGPPPVPQGFAVQAYETSQALLTWEAAPGAQGYSIYAVGSTGNALMAASPSPSASASASSSAGASASPTTSASASPSASSTVTSSVEPTSTPAVSAAPSSEATAPAASPTPTASAPAAASPVAWQASSGTARIQRASVWAGGDSPTTPASSGSVASLAPSPMPSPSGSGASGSLAPSSSSSTSGTAAEAANDIESPSCGDCTHVADVPSGTTRYIVTKTMPGQQNCYRIIATAGEASSLYTPSMCVAIAGVPEAGAGGTSDGSSSDGSMAQPAACPPYLPLITPLSSTSLAITWLPPTEYQESEPGTKSSGKKARARASASAAASPPVLPPQMRSAPQAAPLGGGTPSPTAGASAPPCNPQAPITGFELQRQLVDGWITVSPPPAASDTAAEVTGLQPGTKYCFRMRSLASPTPSAYTPDFCKSTQKESSPSPSPSPTPTMSSTPTPTPSPTPTDPTGGGSSPAAAIVIEGVL